MFLLWTNIGKKSFMKERVWKTFKIKDDHEIIGTTKTKNKKIFLQTYEGKVLNVILEMFLENYWTFLNK